MRLKIGHCHKFYIIQYIIINYIFGNVSLDMGRSLFAGLCGTEGEIWVIQLINYKREKIKLRFSGGRNGDFSVEMTKVMFFTRKRNGRNTNLKLYGNSLETVESFRFLGVHFDSRLTWRHHVRSIMDKCKLVINVMKCLVGLDQGAKVAYLKYMQHYKAGLWERRSTAKTVFKELDQGPKTVLRSSKSITCVCFTI